VRYEVPVASLIDRAGNAGGPVVSVGGAGLQAASAGAADGSRSIEVAGVPGLVLYVTPRPANPLRTSGLRALLWLSGLAGVAGLAAFGRGLAREARAIDRERAFLAGVTHELRTPLTSIRVLGETLANGRGEPREYGALVAQESQRLAALIERVLTLTRLEEVVRFGRVHPAELLCRTLSIPGLPAHERGTHLDWQAPDGLPECQWDAEAVSRAILNLVDNAIRHGRHGGRVAVSARQEGDAILLAVSDDGTGVGRADRRRVFGRFERGHTSAGGTGLGLYLVEAVARAHGGRVDLVSAEGHGSTFTLVLPVYPPGSLAAAASPS
jgi:signal transduction histidine kinase